MIIYYRKLQTLFNVRMKVWIFCRGKCNLCYDCLLCEMNTEEYLAIVVTYLMSICINISFAVYWKVQKEKLKNATVIIPKFAPNVMNVKPVREFSPSLIQCSVTNTYDSIVILVKQFWLHSVIIGSRHLIWTLVSFLLTSQT